MAEHNAQIGRRQNRSRHTEWVQDSHMIPCSPEERDQDRYDRKLGPSSKSARAITISKTDTMG